MEVTNGRCHFGDKIEVKGKRTATVGLFEGIGLTEDGKPRILIRVFDSPILFAYDFDEVVEVMVLKPAPQGDRVEMAEPR